MASNGVGPDVQNVRLAPGETFAFKTTPGLSGTRYWPKMRCNSTGNACLLGESGGPGETCDLAIGCAPPVDTKFEASFGSGSAPDWVDVSLVDGWTLPFRFEMSQRCSAGEGSRGVGNVVDCSHLSFQSCPTVESVGAASVLPLNLEVKHPTTGGVVGCYAPCSKLTFSNWGNKAAKYAPADAEAKDYCCPTPPESPEQCRKGPVGSTHFVQAVHQNCPGVYGYSYDDGMGLILCPPNTTYDMTFYCPKDLNSTFPKGPVYPAPGLPTTKEEEAVEEEKEKWEEEEEEEEECPGMGYAVAATRSKASEEESFKLSHHRHLFKDYVAMRTSHGRYMVAEPDGFVSAAAHAVSYWELFKMEKHSGGRISLRSMSGSYLRAEGYGAVRASEHSVGEAELFEKVDNDDGTVSLKASNGNFLSATRTCHGDMPEDCFEQDVAYLPLDITGMTREASALLCQARCLASGGCDHFSFYAEGGFCHLQAASATRVPLSLGSVAGPSRCSLITVRKDLLPSRGLLRGAPLQSAHLGAFVAMGLMAAVALLAMLAACRTPRRQYAAATSTDDATEFLTSPRD
uniref:Apple domain-containing protein n=1 Tax=Alexandrium andersonii TaxID=327968 RepID=A0A7S2HG63_9DINO